MRKTIFDFDLCPVIPSPPESLLPGQNCFPVRIKTFSAHVKSKNELHPKSWTQNQLL